MSTARSSVHSRSVTSRISINQERDTYPIPVHDQWISPKSTVAEISNPLVRYDWSTTSLSDAVIDAVRGVVGSGPTSFGPPCGQIDPGALNSLFGSNGTGRTAGGIHVSFSLADRLVVVHGSGEIVVRTATRNGIESDSKDRPLRPFPEGCSLASTRVIHLPRIRPRTLEN